MTVDGSEGRFGQHESADEQRTISRRQFVTGAGVLAAGAAVSGLTACGPAAKAPASEGNDPAVGAPEQKYIDKEREVVTIGSAKKTTMILHTTKTYDSAKIAYAALDGEPSQNHYFVPTADEGVRNRVYPDYDAKTFKFLSLSSPSLYPQTYYLFDKDGGSLDPALEQYGYKATRIIDQGHIKILPNLMVGYYDFAYLSVAILSELWSGNASMNPELWRQGNDYVIVGSSTNGGNWLLARPEITSLTQLADTTVGIMNPAYNMELLLNKALSAKGLATESIGGNVGIEMGSPGYVMNDLLAGDLSAVFSWSLYTGTLQKDHGYKVLVPWNRLGYGDQMPNMVLVARRDIIEKHPEIVQTVVQLNYAATQKGIANGDYKAPLAAVSREFQTKYMGHPPNPPAGEAPLQAEAPPRFLKDLVAFMNDAGYLKVPYTYEQLVDQSFYQKVKK